MKSFEELARTCPPLLGGALAQPAAEQLATALKVLADPARLRLISILAARPDGEACVCDLIEPLGLSQPTVSHHLKILYEARLLDRARRGSWVHYRLLPERLHVLRDLLTDGAPVASAAGG